MSTTAPDAPASRILVVEDEAAIADVVATTLRHQGHTVEIQIDGHRGWSAADRGSFDLLVLDVMLPGLDGFEICRRLRADGHDVPVLFLTARGAAADRVDGFASGGDDYLTKPFSIDELAWRVAAILRRTAPVADDRLVVGDLHLDPGGRDVRRSGRSIDLSATEFDLLHYLVVNQGIVVSKAQILANVWDDDFDGSENVVELYIGYLRRKLDTGSGPLIHTKRGAGYVLRVERP